MTTPAPDSLDPIRAARAEAREAGVDAADPDQSAFAGEAAGDEIGRYELIEELGAGGMGTVWVAQQEEPVKRRVALKIIKLGMDTRDVIVRFEAERQALALMDHPHIAKVLDGGATETGRPYFVMELVPGTPITTYCDQARLGLRERLELFALVCEAIQHAHQKGIIHRDIKPSNVLVALSDGAPVPKVIDFGIAKATSAELTHKTLLTQHAAILGTPEYMAPEQAEQSGLDIDTRADVYSLGVLLYELLTGTKPFEFRTAVEAGYQELLRTIREVEPAKPSTRVSTLGDDATPIASNRHVHVAALSSRLRGDLDWIAMKALEKDRARRYETASGLAADIERFLNREPVLAAPPSALYRAGKFVQRRKGTVAAIAAIAFLLVVGSVGTGIGWWTTVKANRRLDVALGEKTAALTRETEQRERAERNEERALSAEESAREAEEEARQRADELDQVATFQAEQLEQIDPNLMGVRVRSALTELAREDRREALSEGLVGVNFTSLSLRILQENLFDRTLAAIDERFTDQPLVQAQLLRATGTTLLGLGLLEPARASLEKALAIHRRVLGNEVERTLVSVNVLALILQAQGLFAEAEPYFVEALEGKRRVLGEEHPHTLIALNNLGSLYQAQGRFEQAETYLREAVASQRRTLGEDHGDTLTSINNLALLLYKQGRLDEAEERFNETLAGMRRVLGNEHPNTLSAMGNLGLLLQEQGRAAEAEPLVREALEGRRRRLGDDHPATLISMSSLGLLLQSQGKLSEAEAFGRQVLEVSRRVQGDDHPDTLTSIGNVAFLLGNQGKSDEAEAMFREAVEGMRRVLGDDHPQTRNTIPPLTALLRRRIEIERVGEDRTALGRHMAELGSLALLQGDPVAAEQALSEGYEILRDELGDAHWTTLTAMSAHGTALARQGRFDEAEYRLVDSVEWMLEVESLPRAARWLGVDPVGVCLSNVVEFYQAWHALDSTAGHDERAHAWRERLQTTEAQHGR